MKNTDKENRRNDFKFSNTGNVFMLAFILYYAVSIAYSIAMMVVYGDTANWPAAAQWCSYILNPLVFMGTCLVYSKKKNVNVVNAAKLNKKISFKQVGIIFALSIFCIMAFLPISNIFLDLLGRLGFNMSLSFADTSASVGAYFLGLLLLAVFPALSEEFLMRGVVLNAAEQRRDYSYAILITAGMFSLMHGNPIQTVHQFLLGMVLAYIVLVSRSLWAAVLLHLFNNFWSLTLDYPFNWFLRVTGMGYMADGYWYIIWIVCIVFGGTMVLYLLRKFTNISRDKRKFGETVVIDVYPEGQKKAKKNDFENAFLSMFSIFKRGGFKRAYQKVNDIIKEIVPENEEPVVPLTREDFFPSNIKLAYLLLAIIWLLTLVSGFIE